MGFYKNGNINNSIVENGLTSVSFPGFKDRVSTVKYESDQYTITSPVISNKWGAAFDIIASKICVPYSVYYKISMEVYVPTTHKIVIDINNSPSTSSTNSWNGNDNDLNSARFYSSMQIPAKTWTTIYWGSQNLNSQNTDHVDIFVYDSIGLYTADDTEAITWYIKNPKVEIEFSIDDNISINDSIIKTNDFLEI